MVRIWEQGSSSSASYRDADATPVSVTDFSGRVNDGGTVARFGEGTTGEVPSSISSEFGKWINELEDDDSDAEDDEDEEEEAEQREGRAQIGGALARLAHNRAGRGGLGNDGEGDENDDLIDLAGRADDLPGDVWRMRGAGGGRSLRDDMGEAEERDVVTRMIGMDDTVDGEEEEDEYDRLAEGMGGGGFGGEGLESVGLGGAGRGMRGKGRGRGKGRRRGRGKSWQEEFKEHVERVQGIFQRMGAGGFDKPSSPHEPF